jgi:HSP20 family protein
MALIRWEPVPSRLFTSLFDTPTVATVPGRRFAPATDLIESETHYIVRADLPGLSEDDINVELDGNLLSISGERSSEDEQRTGGYLRVERSSGSFRRSVRLPQGIDGNAIEASFDRGVLEVSVPKPEQARPHKIAITTTSTAPAIGSADAPADEPADEPAAA